MPHRSLRVRSLTLTQAVGVVVERQRRALEWDVPEVAQAAELQESEVWRLEACGVDHDVSLATLEKLAAALHVPVWRLVAWAEQVCPPHERVPCLERHAVTPNVRRKRRAPAQPAPAEVVRGD